MAAGRFLAGRDSAGRGPRSGRACALPPRWRPSTRTPAAAAPERTHGDAHGDATKPHGVL